MSAAAVVVVAAAAAVAAAAPDGDLVEAIAVDEVVDGGGDVTHRPLDVVDVPRHGYTVVFSFFSRKYICKKMKPLGVTNQNQIHIPHATREFVLLLLQRCHLKRSSFTSICCTARNYLPERS